MATPLGSVDVGEEHGVDWIVGGAAVVVVVGGAAVVVVVGGAAVVVVVGGAAVSREAVVVVIVVGRWCQRWLDGVAPEVLLTANELTKAAIATAATIPPAKLRRRRTGEVL